MHQELIVARLEPLLSAKKIIPYQQKFGNNWFKIYKNELIQAQEIFVHLNFLEIFLRNKIALEFTLDFGDWLFDEQVLHLNMREKIKINEVIATLDKLSKNIDQDNMISNLNFGFWTNIFHKSYNSNIWQRNKMIERIFPFLKDYERSLKQIQKDMENIRKLRNRIFHFENLCDFDLDEMKKVINRFIFGIGGMGMREILGDES